MQSAAATQDVSPGYWARFAAMAAPGEWLYRDAQYLVAEMEIDAVAAGRWVPAPLRLASPARASVFTSFFPSTTFESVYREAGVFLHVVHGKRPCVFSPWMIVDDDVALVLGRELLGYPKKLGEIAFERDGERVMGAASRRGADLLRMHGTLGDRVDSPRPMLGRPHRNVRSSLGLALPKVIAFTPREEIVECRAATLDVAIHGSTRDPLAELGFGRVLCAFLYRVHLGASFLPVPVSFVSPLWFLRQWLLRAH